MTEIFWNLWKKLNYKQPLEKTFSFTFKIMSGRTFLGNHVFKSASETIYFISAFCTTSLQWQNRKTIEALAEKYEWQTTPTFSFPSASSALQSSITLNPLNCFGYIVQNEFEKSQSYVIPALRVQLMESCKPFDLDSHFVANEKLMLEAILVDCSDLKFIELFPKQKKIYDRVAKKLFDLKDTFQGAYDHLEKMFQQSQPSEQSKKPKKLQKSEMSHSFNQLAEDYYPLYSKWLCWFYNLKTKASYDKNHQTCDSSEKYELAGDWVLTMDKKAIWAILSKIEKSEREEKQKILRKTTELSDDIWVAEKIVKKSGEKFKVKWQNQEKKTTLGYLPRV